VDFEGRVRRPPDAPPPNELPIGDEADTAANYARLVGCCGQGWARQGAAACSAGRLSTPPLLHTYAAPRARQVPRPVPRDHAKWLAHAGTALRFAARLAGPLLTHFDGGRSFVVSFFPADDTLAVFEPPRRNSGFPGGAFAERARVRRPGGGGAADWYRPRDMAVRAGPAAPAASPWRRSLAPIPPAANPPAPRPQVGATVTVSGRAFLLEDADEATLKAMAADPAAFPFADARQVRGGRRRGGRAAGG
jgi:hypothetical protein